MVFVQRFVVRVVERSQVSGIKNDDADEAYVHYQDIASEQYRLNYDPA